MPILDKMTQIDAKLSAIVAYILCTFTQDFQELMHYIFAMYVSHFNRIAMGNGIGTCLKGKHKVDKKQ